ncbi:hypothetical protein MKEN_01137000 [Mycena kentingensis (nom. inval.)]|nr:hypothetical protein MKEN_01137000 [Mycena kentingensis (nom. inval.)]
MQRCSADPRLGPLLRSTCGPQSVLFLSCSHQPSSTMIVPTEMKLNPPETSSIPLDAPPAYDASSSRSAPVEKPATRSPTSPSPVAGPSFIKARVVQKNTWEQLGDDVAGAMATLGLGSARSRAQVEIRKTITGLLHDLVHNQTIDSNVACASILDSCSEAAAQNGINLPHLLQQAYIQGHSPLYWSIVKRPAESSEVDRPASEAELPPLIRALLAYSAPLKPATVADIRLACLHTCDEWLFQCLRCSPDFAALPQKDQLLLGVKVPPDTLKLRVPAKHDAPFTVDFAFTEFQKRLRVTHEVKLEFITHSRIWDFAFVHYINGSWGIQAGQWAARLTLSDHSPQTNLESVKITILPGPTPASEGEEEIKPVILEFSGRLYTGNELNAAMPDSFQYPNNPFLVDGTLRGTLEIKLKL